MKLKENWIKVRARFDKFLEKAAKTEVSDFWKVYQKFFKRLPDIFHLKNIVLFSVIGSVVILILFGQRFRALDRYLPKEPLRGGVYTEGVVGKIEQLNPLFALNNSAETSAVSVIFSGLTKKDNNRKIIPDLARSWTISEDEKIYTFTLKEGLFWQDGRALTADDFVFTIETIQNPDTKSPLLKVWRGIEVKKVDDKRVSFVLPSPNAGFLGKADFSVLPKHLLENIQARSLISSEFSKSPVGSGPYAFSEIKNIKESQEVILKPSQYYYGQKPYIEKLVFKTYRNYSSLLSAYSRREVLGIERVPSKSLSSKENLPNIGSYNLIIPEYEVAYFNLRSDIVKDRAVREAFNLAVSRRDIVKKVYDGFATPVYQPYVSGFLGHLPGGSSDPNVAEAKAKLESAGYALDPGGIYVKDGKRLSIRFVILNNSEKNSLAEVLKANLREAGIDLLIEKYQFGPYIQNHIRPRDFDVILVTQNLGLDSDIYSFWHSAGVNDPGLNLSGLNDRRLDKFLEQARTMKISDIESRKTKYKDVAAIINETRAAVYLVWPNYIYGVSREVKGPIRGRYVEPKDRFWNIQDWYILEKKSPTI